MLRIIKDMVTPELDEKTRNFPDQPGVYLMKNERGKVIYVGKAKSLRKRVRSYFQKSDDGRVWSPFLSAHVADVDFIVTDTEKEAIILEDSAIKEYKPRYNIRLKDDKSFLRLKLTVNEEYPRLLITRKVKRDGAMYFGPYSSAYAARETYRVINKHFMLRKCSDDTFRNRSRPCIYYGMDKCMGPCVGKVDKKTYNELVQNVIAFLQGKDQELLDELRSRMQEASDNLQFEVAARYRDQIHAIEKTIERQKVVAPDQVDRDFFGIYREDGSLEEADIIGESGSLGVTVLTVRKGKIVGSIPYHFNEVKAPIDEAIGSLLTQFYSGEHDIPKEIALPLAPENEDAIEQWLSEKKGEHVSIITPRRGHKHQLLEMAEMNAKTIFEENQRAEMAAVDVLEKLQEALSLRKRPERVEAFDISNISGQLAVGSMVVFEDGKPKKADYRRYKIRTVEGADDYAMMREVLTRRLSRAIEEGPMPSLIIVDGGKGQLNVALSVLDELQIIEQDVVGIAKERILYRRKSEIATKEADKIYIPHRKDPIILRPGSPALRLVQHIRDEAHRFAISYHKQIRSRAHTRSILDEIRGIGPRRRTLLLKRFGSVKKIAEASAEEISTAAGIPLGLAKEVKAALSQSKGIAAGSNQ